MRRIIAGLAAAAALVPVAGVAHADSSTAAAPAADATVNIVPVVPGATETAQVDLNSLPTGGFAASGTGSGFNPISQYVSLVYGVNSVPVQTGNIGPCADDGTLGDPNTSTLRMFVGAWLPVVGGNRAMAGTQPTTNINQTNTMSLRRANVPVLPPPGDIRPNVFQIRSCGQIQQ